MRALILLACWLAAPLAGGEIIDTHVHLWHLDRPEGIYWIKKDNATLYRSFTPADHEPIAKANGVSGVVIVQAGQHLPDNQWNLDVTAHNKALYRGVVGNLSTVIGTEKFKPLFDKLCKDKRYVGYRLSSRAEGQGLTDEFFRDLELTAERGKTVDFLIGGYSMADVAVIAERVPKLKIILDHFGKVVLEGKPLDPEWIKSFRAAAKHPNIYCKVSALYGRVKKQPAPRDIEFYRPVLDLAFEAFGEDRLVFGSDWPVTRTSGDYASVLELTRAYFDARGQAVSEKLFHQNATRFYGLGKKLEGLDAALDKLDLPGVKIQLKDRCVDVDGEVCLDGGALELIACTKDSKEHESIIAIDAKPMHIHTALLLLGAKSGNPAMRKRIGEGAQERWIDIPPSGGAVDVSLVFKDEKGKQVERPINDFIKSSEEEWGAETKAEFPTHTFLFAGSHLVATGKGPKTYLSDQSGNVISIATFGDELLCLPEVHGHENGSLLWEIDSTHLPEVGAKVILRLRPKLK